MIVTAQSGAFGKRDTREFLEEAKNYDVDAVEVEVRARGNALYVSPIPRLTPQKSCMELGEAVDFAKSNGLNISCRLKAPSSFKRVTEIIAERGMEKRSVICGRVKKSDLATANCDVYLGESFFGRSFRGNAGLMKARIESMANPKIKGIDIKSDRLTDEFLRRCADVELAVSAYAANDEEEQKRLVGYPIVVNVSSVIPDYTLYVLHRQVKKETKRGKKS